MVDAEQRRTIIDAHQHFWDLDRNRHPWLQDDPPIAFRYGDYRALRRNYLPDDYRTDTQGWRIAGTVHIEAEWEPGDPVGEQRWLERLRRAEGLPSVSVCQAWLDHPDIEAVLAEQAAFPFVRGIRHKPVAASRPDAARRGARGSMDDPCWRAGFAALERHGFSFDLQTPFWHADATQALARDFPRTTIIINHTFLPADRSTEGLDAWRSALAQVAGSANVMMKISGLGLAGQAWDAIVNGPVIQDVIAAFGAERCMFASNFPVDRLVGDFATIFSGFAAAVSALPPATQDAMFRGNAARIYRIQVDASGTVGRRSGER